MIHVKCISKSKLDFFRKDFQDAFPFKSKMSHSNFKIFPFSWTLKCFKTKGLMFLSFHANASSAHKTDIWKLPVLRSMLWMSIWNHITSNVLIGLKKILWPRSKQLYTFGILCFLPFDSFQCYKSRWMEWICKLSG